VYLRVANSACLLANGRQNTSSAFATGISLDARVGWANDRKWPGADRQATLGMADEFPVA
jgi:hypothetical protein